MKAVYSRLFQEIAGGLMILAVFVLPFFVWAGGSKDIHVNDNASGTQDGSAAHPYKTISEALRHADKGDEVHVASGKYKENIDIPDHVEVFGEDEDDVIIEADDNDEPVATLHHKSMINKVTLKGGSHGVRVAKDSGASIIRCIIKDNDKDGVSVRSAKVEKKYEVVITESVIKNNDRAGVFSERRRVVLIDNDIHDNGSDGTDLARGSRAFIDDNTFHDNEGSGLKMALDDSTVLVASKNTFRDNKHEGIEVNTYGKTGAVTIKKSRFVNNHHYGIARIQRVPASADVWKGLTTDANTFSGNNRGEISPILNIR